jgi:YHS domain-containing protein
MAADPVCGMTVDPTTDRKTGDERGTTFYVYCPGCKKAFHAAPSASTGRPPGSDNSDHHGRQAALLGGGRRRLDG